MITVVVLLVLMAMAVPSLMNATHPMRLRNDASSIANLLSLARMRASAEFSRIKVVCNTAPTSGPASCQMQSLPYPGTGSYTVDSQKLQVTLSAGVSFGIPPSITTLPLTQTVAVQGDAVQGVTTNPLVLYNSRGIPLDPVALQPAGDFAFYLRDTTGKYMAIAVDLTGRPTIYTFTNGVFTPLPN
jgi:Tfp pilus assembly protein FimT